MHHFIFPSQDTFITNTPGFEDSNFGLDETLRVGTEIVTIQVPSPPLLVNISSSLFSSSLSNFSGSIINSVIGSTTSSFAYGVITSSIISSASISYFNGVLTGSYYSSSLVTNNSFTGSLNNFSGSIIGIFSGSVSGSLLNNYLNYFNGIVNGFYGIIFTGSVNGVESFLTQNTTTSDIPFVNRALVQFDITAISQSISCGDILNPKFVLKLNVAREFELPIQYSIYAFPISESWVMGNGYVSDGGSSMGANWLYKDNDLETPWGVTGSSYIQSLGVTQSFNYQVGDICMDVTSIATAWLSGSIPNNGIILISSDEFNPTASGMNLYFFSKDTNTIYEPILDVSWNDSSWITGSVITSSINLSTIAAGLNGIVSNTASISGSLFGCFTGIGNIFVDNTNSASGLISATGTCGLIVSMSIIGNMSGSVSNSIRNFVKKCHTFRPNFNNGIMGYGDGSVGVGGFGYADTNSWPVGTGDLFWQGGRGEGGQYNGQYEGHDIYGWGDPFNEFNQYDWWSGGDGQQYFGFPMTGSCGCSGVNGHNWMLDKIYDPCIDSHIQSGNWVNGVWQRNITGSCNSCAVTMSFLMGTLVDGIFSGSTFTSSFCNGYLLGLGFLMGRWNPEMILGTTITASYPFTPSYPLATNVTFSGPYVNGTAFGSITQLSASYGLCNYGTFNGVFTSGLFAGYKIFAPFTGSILTSSYSFVNSINTTSSILTPVDMTKPFTTIIQNIPSSVKSGDMIKINVFARDEFPLKNFNRQTQFTQFLIPEYLPSQSFYLIKDNQTEEIILNSDQYTQLSCDQNGNYFILDTTGFPQERYFRILIRIEGGSSIYTIDNNNIFKIIR